jgi:hypothetical protein
MNYKQTCLSSYERVNLSPMNMQYEELVFKSAPKAYWLVVGQEIHRWLDNLLCGQVHQGLVLVHARYL